MPARPCRACAATLALLLGGSSRAQAQVGVPLNRLGSGARAAGMGNAFIAVSDDGTAASWNPAGLAQLREPELSFVYVVSDRKLQFSSLRSPDLRVSYSAQRFVNTNAWPDFASAALPFSIARRPVTVQLGWQRLYQLDSQLAGSVDRFVMGDPAGPATILRQDQLLGDIDVISVAGAVKLTSRMALGASADFWGGQWTNRVSWVEGSGARSPAAFLAFDGRARMSGRNFTVGLLLTHPSWSAGLVYHAPFWSSYHQQTVLHGTGLPSQDIGWSTRFRLPRSMGAGVSRRLASRWTAAFALTHDQWTDSLLEELTDGTGPVNFFDELPPELSTTRDTLALNLGVERLFVREGSVVPLRLGFGWEPQGAMDSVARDPVDFVLLSGGGGYNTNRFKFDAAVQYRWASSRVTDRLTVSTVLAGNPARDGEGTASTQEWRLKVSVIYRMPDTEKLRGVIRKIFG